MLEPQNRFVTLILAAGAVVLLVAIAVGEHMGERVLGQATEQIPQSVAPIQMTPAPDQTSGPYGPDWKRSETLSAAGDPHFPDPRIPPQPLPTLAPAPTPSPTASASPTINPNIPIWRQVPLPTPIGSPQSAPASPPQAAASPGGPTSQAPP